MGSGWPPTMPLSKREKFSDIDGSLPFSCKVFQLCPSCDQKRALLYAEYLAEDLLLDLPHRQFVFTIPKILRPYFKSDKRLFGEVFRLIFSLLFEFFSLAAGQELLCACVVSYQSFGEFARFHPHWHVLVLEGGFAKYERFVYLPISADEGMLKVWQAAILSMFLRKELIDQARVNMLKDWKHSGFSIRASRKPSRILSLSTNWYLICRHAGSNWCVAMECTQKKSASSGKKALVFIDWPQKAGKKGIRTRPSVWQQYRKKVRQLFRLPMHGSNGASKAGHGCYRKYTK